LSATAFVERILVVEALFANLGAGVEEVDKPMVIEALVAGLAVEALR
jgi:hypothetical protein